jgi:transposase
MRRKSPPPWVCIATPWPSGWPSHTTNPAVQPPRRSKLDPYKADIVRWLDSHPLSAAQIFQRLREQGYDGGYSILTDYVRQIRPPQPPAYLKLAFAPGECAQVD